MIAVLILLGVAAVQAADLVLTVPLEAAQSAPVHALLAGQVKRIAVEEGKQVVQGDTLIWLDDTELRLTEEEARLAWHKAQNFLDRIVQLKAQASLSRLELEEVQYQAQTTRLHHQRAQLELSRAVILAPLSGQVADLQVQPGSLTSPRQVLCQILGGEDLKASLFLPADRMASVRLHQPVMAWPVTAPALRLTGRIVRLSPIVDPQSGSCRAEALFPGAGRRIKPGTVASVRLNEEKP